MLLPQRMGPLGRSTGEGPPFASIFSDLMSGAAYVSPQLPLHRCAAACIGLGIAAAWLPDVEGMSPTTRKGSGGAGRAERDLTRDGGEGERGMSRGEEEEEAGSRGGEEEEGSRGGEEEAGPAFVEHCVKEKGPLWSALAFDVLRQAVWLSQAQQRRVATRRLALRHLPAHHGTVPPSLSVLCRPRARGPQRIALLGMQCTGLAHLSTSRKLILGSIHHCRLLTVVNRASRRFWVRNGTAPRSIAHHARSSIRTDLCTAPDTLCLQLWLASCQDADGDRPLHLTPIICVILLTVHLIEAIAVPAACPGSHLAWAAVLHERRERETLVVSAEALVSFLSAFGGPEMKHTLAMAVASQPGRAEGEGREEGARANAVKMGTWEVRWLSGGENAGATTGGTASGAVSEAVRAAEAVGWAMAGVEETIGTLSALKTWDDGRRMQCFVDGVRTVVACMKDRGMWGMSLGERSRYEVLQR